MEQKLISIGKAAKLIGVSIATLRRWDKSGKLVSFRPTKTSKRYYRQEEFDFFINDLEAVAKAWATKEIASELRNDFYCQTKDVFDARLSRLQNELGKIPGMENILPLVVSVAGEIGNNSFDHNLGMWPDVPGIFFGFDFQRRKVVLADRGQGILETLKRVRPGLKTDEEALRTAFTEIISGRAPEARGNGLKYVRKVISENSMTLEFWSGNSRLCISKDERVLPFFPVSPSFHGTIAVINF